MTKNQKKKPSRRKRAINAAIAGFILGAIFGAIIGAYYGLALPGALAGGLLVGSGEAITDWRRLPGQQKPRLYRMLMALVSSAFVGALVGLFLPNLNLLLQGLLIGLVIGLSNLNLKRLGLSTACGFLVALVISRFTTQFDPVLLSLLITLLFLVLAEILLPHDEPIVLNAEQVPVENIPYVVPFAAQSKVIGADYFRELAQLSSGLFQRNAPDVGIIESMDSLRGPTFDPDLLHPLIREFYEHTTRFKLDIIPVWKVWMKPIFGLYKQWIAQPIGQANLPFNQEEAQRGVVSYIDTIDLGHDQQIDIRGWVRAFEASAEAIYVGVYTTFRHEQRGYVSVGFPMPGFNFTATLLPYNKDGRNFILKTKGTGLPFPGHYMAFIEEGQLTVLELPTFNEEIEVLVDQGQLKTHHRFYLGNQNFLTLYYDIGRLV